MRIPVAAAVAILWMMPGPAPAQWFNYPKKSTARTPDGKPNLNAPAPKQADGKPDLSGVWLGDNWQPAGRRPNPVILGGRGGTVPKMTAAGQKEWETRTSEHIKDDPKVR